MKKIALLLALLMFILPITANAAVTRNVNISPGLKISGTTATCSALIVGNAEDDEIEIVVKLWNGSNRRKMATFLLQGKRKKVTVSLTSEN